MNNILNYQDARRVGHCLRVDVVDFPSETEMDAFKDIVTEVMAFTNGIDIKGFFLYNPRSTGLLLDDGILARMQKEEPGKTKYYIGLPVQILRKSKDFAAVCIFHQLSHINAQYHSFKFSSQLMRYLAAYFNFTDGVVRDINN